MVKGIRSSLDDNRVFPCHAPWQFLLRFKFGLRVWFSYNNLASASNSSQIKINPFKIKSDREDPRNEVDDLHAVNIIFAIDSSIVFGCRTFPVLLYNKPVT